MWLIVAILSGYLPHSGLTGEPGKLNLHQIYDAPAANLPVSDFALPQPVPQVTINSVNLTHRTSLKVWISN